MKHARLSLERQELQRYIKPPINCLDERVTWLFFPRVNYISIGKRGFHVRLSQPVFDLLQAFEKSPSEEVPKFSFSREFIKKMPGENLWRRAMQEIKKTIANGTPEGTILNIGKIKQINK